MTRLHLQDQTARPRRVLLCMLSCGLRGGGIASVNRNVVRSLATLHGSGHPLATRAVYLGGSDAALPRGYVGDMPLDERFSNGGRIAFASEVLKQAVCWRPDVIFVDHLHLAAVAYLLRPATRGYVLFCHGIEFDGEISRLRQRAFAAAGLRLSNSRFTARRLMEKFPPAEVRPCELGLDDVQLDEGGGLAPLPVFRDADGLVRQPSARAVSIVGRLDSRERYKGHDQLVDVFGRVVAAAPDAQLWIIGTGDDLDRLRAKARKSSARSNILFSGFVTAPELAATYRECAVFAMPSRGEGFGLVYLEAMRHAKPCIASTVDAGSEVVVDGQTGLHVDPDDLATVERAVLRLLEDASLRTCMGAAGQRRLEQHYRFEHFRDRFVAALGQLGFR